MELVLSLEKLNFQKLRHLHEVAEKHGDAQMCDFVGEWREPRLHGRCAPRSGRTTRNYAWGGFWGVDSFNLFRQCFFV